MEVSNEVSNIDTRFTPLLSRMLSPEIFFTVGPGFPTTCIGQEEIAKWSLKYPRIIRILSRW